MSGAPLTVFGDGRQVRSFTHVADTVCLVRATRPEIVAIPYWDDRHPDHRAASQALSRAVFTAGLAFMALGAATLWLPPGSAHIVLALGFGGIHLALGTTIVRHHGG